MIAENRLVSLDKAAKYLEVSPRTIARHAVELKIPLTMLRKRAFITSAQLMRIGRDLKKTDKQRKTFLANTRKSRNAA